MSQDKRKVVLVGTGFVGMSFAYSLLSSSNGVDQLVLIDMDTEKALGEAMDLQHGLPYAEHKMEIKSGDYSEVRDADIVVVTAGVTQKPGQTRLELAAIDAKIMKSITEQCMENGFDGIFVIASNPVDLMTYVCQKVSGLPKNRVIGSGTLLDTARLRYLLSEHLNISTSNVHAYVIGEHGDSSFVPWSHAFVGAKNMKTYFCEKGLDEGLFDALPLQVQQAAYEIISRKRSTYYGVGLALNRLVKAILTDENVILTVSCYQDGQYGVSGLYNGAPALINNNGVQEVVELHLDESECALFKKSCNALQTIIDNVIDPLL